MGCCGRLSQCMCMETSWAAKKPLFSSSSGKLRIATVISSLFSAVLGFFCIIYFSSAGWDELHWAAAPHPRATVFFLTWLYYIHFVNALLICVSANMCLIGMWFSPHGVPGTCTWPGYGNISTILILSRALRVTFWTAFFTIWVVVLVGQDTCRDVDAYEAAAQKSHFCSCIAEAGVLDEHRDHFVDLQQKCRPKTFHTCLSHMGSGNHSLCGSQCLSADRTHVYDRTECDIDRCLALDDSLGCYWGEYECPSRIEDFNDVVLEHKHRYCRYSSTGDLISTNFSPVTPTRTDLDEEIHSELHDVTVDLLGGNGVSMAEVLAGAGLLEDGAVCVFSAGDGSCTESATCTQKLLSGSDQDVYVGPADESGNPVGGIYPRSAPDPRPGIWSEEACAEYVMETEPSANGATFSGPKNVGGRAFTYPFCYAEFNTDGTVRPNRDDDPIAWSTCRLTPTDDMFLTLVSIGSDGTSVVPAQCRLEWVRSQQRSDEEVTICNAVVDGALFVVCILLLLATYWFSRMQYSYFLTIDPGSVARLAAGGSEGAHVQLEDVGAGGGSSESTETAHDARP